MLKGSSRTKNFYLCILSFPALLTPLTLIPFHTEEITGCTNETDKGANKAERNPSSCLFISYFTVSVIPLINLFETSNDYIIHMFILNEQSNSFSCSHSFFCT